MIECIAKRPTLAMIARALPVALIGVVICAATASRVSAQTSKSPVIHHDLSVVVDPTAHRLTVRDRIAIPGALVTAPLTLSLNADLRVQASGGLTLVPVGARVPGSDPGLDRDASSRTPVNRYRVEGAITGQDWTGELS